MRLNTEPITQQSRFWELVNVLAREAFPPEEYLAPSELVKMARADDFDFLALLDGDAFVGFMVVKTYENLAYLFFLAIDAGSRGKGYGSRAIETLKEEYPDKTHTVDFEMPDDAAPNREQREKRRSFYLRNGYRETGLFLSYLGVDYEVFCMGERFDADAFKAMMQTIQVEGFHPRYFTKPFKATRLEKRPEKAEKRALEKTIQTDRLLLRPLSPDDLETVHEYASDPENTRYMLFLPNASIAETAAFLASAEQEWQREQPTSFEFAVVLDGLQIGAVFVALSEEGEQGEIGWILNKKYWNRGYATEAAKAVLAFAKEQLHLRQAVAHCDARNAASANVMKKLGMRLADANGTRTYAKRGETARELTYIIDL